MIRQLIPSSPLFPSGEIKNPTIIVPDKIKGSFSAVITNMTPDLHILETWPVFFHFTHMTSRVDGTITSLNMPSRHSVSITKTARDNP